jgi:hypothetical protein
MRSSLFCATYSSEQVLFEVELVVCVLLNHLEDLDCLCDDLMPICELVVVKDVRELVPQDRRRHLDAVSCTFKLRAHSAYRQERQCCAMALFYARNV